jgi:NADH-quinone oxidoreductase subunit J
MSASRILTVIALVLSLAAVAHAQPEPQPLGQVPPSVQQRLNAANVPPSGRVVIQDRGAPDDHPAPRPPGVPGISTPSTDVDTGSGTGMALLFWVFAGLAVGGSLFVITRRNLIAAVMGMVGTFFALAVLYMMLYASFLAIIQMLVYAGAIMVLFVFVIMVLNKPEDEPYGMTGMPGKVLAGLAMLYLLARAVMLLWHVTPPDAKKAADAPPQVVNAWKQVPKAGETPDPNTGLVQIAESYDYGSTAAVGYSLFGEYVFPFEAVSILLLIAVVGAIAIARPFKDDQPATEES